MKAAVFLGGGRITGALIAGLRLASYKAPIVVHDRHAAKLRRFEKRYEIIAEPSLRRAVAAAGLLIPAVRPSSLGELLDQIGPVGRPIVSVSLAAGISLSQLERRLGPPVSWARAMPSPLCRTGDGLTALAFHRRLAMGERRALKRFFQNVGAVIELPESQLDAFTVTYSPSHGYYLLDRLARAAEKIGLQPATARAAAAHALADSVLSWRKTRMPLSSLLNEAATPGGIAASVMAEMNEASCGRLLEKALEAGLARARAYRKQW